MKTVKTLFGLPVEKTKPAAAKKFKVFIIDGTLKEKYYKTFRSIISLNDFCINEGWQWKKDETVFAGYFVDQEGNAYVIR